MNFLNSLRGTNRTRLAIVGGGGKTTSLFRLAQEYSTDVLVSTSTHLGENQAKYANQHIILTSGKKLNRGDVKGITLVTGPTTIEKRLSGLNEEQLIQLLQLADMADIPLLIEADGSRNLPLKAPAEHEPVVPNWVNTVLVCTGLSVLGKQLSPEIVHRAEIFSSLTGLRIGDVVTKEAIQALLMHPRGGLKSIPENARKIVLLNKADTLEEQNIGKQMGYNLLTKYDSSLITSLENPNIEGGEIVHGVCERTAGIVLAAGGASRFGSPKLLVEWCGKPIIYHVVRNAVDSGLSPIIVVLGSVIDPIIHILKDFPIQFAINPDWGSGQSSSVRVGVNSLPTEIGSVVFLLADQPQIPVDLIKGLIDTHYAALSPLIIPQVNNKRANPVLFDRTILFELENVVGDQGGRAIFEKYPITWFPWYDENILLDVDTPDDINNLRVIN